MTIRNISIVTGCAFEFSALGLIALVMVGVVASQTIDYDALCAGQAQNSFIAYPENCEMYILCQNGKALPASCPLEKGTQTWFDPIRQGCAFPGDFCTPPPCTNKDRVFVADPSSECGGWIYCLGGQPSHSAVCPHSLSFVAESQICTYPYCPATTNPASAVPHVML